MKAKSIRSCVAIAAFTIAGLSSCKKEVTDTVVKNQPTTASVEALASEKSEMNYLAYKSIMIAFGATMNDLNMYKDNDALDGLTICGDVTRDTTVFPYQFRIDIQSGCTLNNGTPVSGLIKGSWTNKNFGSVMGSQATLDFDSFYINGNKILGNISLHNKGVGYNGNMTYDFNMANGSMVFGSDGRLVKQDVSWLLEWVTNGTSIKDDDQFSFTGTSTGLTSNGDAYSETITSPLIISRDPNCVRKFIAGTTLSQITGHPDLTLDYGNGTCDSRAEAIQGGVSTRINLVDY